MSRPGPITIELRRHAAMARLGNDSLEFPQPREFRTLSMRIGGISLWSRQAIVGLPAEVDSRLGEIRSSAELHSKVRWFTFRIS